MHSVCNIRYGNFIVNSIIAATSCLGPLITPQNVTIREGGDAELSCSLNSTNRLPITGGSWRREPSSGVIFPALIRTKSGVQWNSTGVNTAKVKVIEKDPHTNFNVILKKVKTKNVYCFFFLIWLRL